MKYREILDGLAPLHRRHRREKERNRSDKTGLTGYRATVAHKFSLQRQMHCNVNENESFVFQYNLARLVSQHSAFFRLEFHSPKRVTSFIALPVVSSLLAFVRESASFRSIALARREVFTLAEAYGLSHAADIKKFEPEESRISDKSPEIFGLAARGHSESETRRVR